MKEKLEDEKREREGGLTKLFPADKGHSLKAHLPQVLAY